MDVRRQGNEGGFAEAPGSAPQHRSAHHTESNGGGMSSMQSKVAAVLISIVCVVVVGWFAAKAFNTVMADSAVKGKQYQAVFLTNGQVYFGKVSNVDSGYLKLTDIYYLQVQQQVQPKDQSSSQQPQVSLAKLGGELHGPEDIMYISRQQMLFWENLKSDGKVAKAIADYKAGGNK
jgi:hypothetical protein